MAKRNAVFPAGRHDLYTSQTYSAAIKSGDLLFVSGQVGSRDDGSPEPDFEAQVRLAFANLEATLKAGGCGLDDIIDVTSFHTDPEHQFGTVMAVKSEVFAEPPYPNWTAIGVNGWAGSISRSRSSRACRDKHGDRSLDVATQEDASGADRDERGIFFRIVRDATRTITMRRLTLSTYCGDAAFLVPASVGCCRRPRRAVEGDRVTCRTRDGLDCGRSVGGARVRP